MRRRIIHPFAGSQSHGVLSAALLDNLTRCRGRQARYHRPVALSAPGRVKQPLPKAALEEKTRPRIAQQNPGRCTLVLPALCLLSLFLLLESLSVRVCRQLPPLFRNCRNQLGLSGIIEKRRLIRPAFPQPATIRQRDSPLESIGNSFKLRASRVPSPGLPPRRRTNP